MKEGVVFILWISMTILVLGFNRCDNKRRQAVNYRSHDDDCKPDQDYHSRFNNVARLYEGDVSLVRLWNSHCLVVGLGGVGSWTCEALARSGVRTLTLMDMDDICISNVNRQIQALTSTVGKFKAEVIRDRILDINPGAIVNVKLEFMRPSNVDEVIGQNRFDFVIDAADGVTDKAVMRLIILVLLRA